MIAAMEEVLSRPGESDKPLNEQEYWTLELLDWTGSWQPGFAVEQARGFWSQIDRQFMFDEIETELCPLLIDAEERYEARRLALVKRHPKLKESGRRQSANTRKSAARLRRSWRTRHPLDHSSHSV
jgi:hypothetical protein